MHSTDVKSGFLLFNELDVRPFRLNFRVGIRGVPVCLRQTNISKQDLKKGAVIFENQNNYNYNDEFKKRKKQQHKSSTTSTSTSITKINFYNKNQLQTRIPPLNSYVTKLAATTTTATYDMHATSIQLFFCVFVL